MMETFTLQVAALLLAGLVLALVGIGAARNGQARLAMLGVFTALLSLIFTSSASLLGRPKPVAFEWLQPQVAEATILSGHLRENQGIYLTLVWGDAEPQLYVLPWDRKTAEQLQQALSEAEQNGTQAMMRLPFKNARQRDEVPFYAPPQPKLPDKPVPQGGIRLG